MNTEQVIVVDEAGNAIGSAPKATTSRRSRACGPTASAATRRRVTVALRPRSSAFPPLG